MQVEYSKTSKTYRELLSCEYCCTNPEGDLCKNCGAPQRLIPIYRDTTTWELVKEKPNHGNYVEIRPYGITLVMKDHSVQHHFIE